MPAGRSMLRQVPLWFITNFGGATLQDGLDRIVSGPPAFPRLRVNQSTSGELRSEFAVSTVTRTSPAPIPMSFAHLVDAPPRLTTLAALSLLAFVATPLAAQRSNVPGLTQSGPLIQSAGQSVLVKNATFTIPDGHVFKAVWEKLP